jgi:hypothetical protein
VERVGWNPENKKPDSEESGLAIVLCGFFLAAARFFSA